MFVSVKIYDKGDYITNMTINPNAVAWIEPYGRNFYTIVLSDGMSFLIDSEGLKMIMGQVGGCITQ